MSENSKTKNMSLFDLGKEYEHHADLQESFINNCKNLIKKAKNSGDTDAVIKLEGELRKFYEIKRELKQTASLLKTYYKGEKYGE